MEVPTEWDAMKYLVTIEVDLGPDYDQKDLPNGAEILVPSFKTLKEAASWQTSKVIEVKGADDK